MYVPPNLDKENYELDIGDDNNLVEEVTWMEEVVYGLGISV